MKNDDKILQSLIASGFISASLGALAIKRKEEDATIAVLANAAALATFKANEKAKEANIPMYEEEAGSLYLIEPGGNTIFVKKIEKPSVTLQKRFKLK